MSRRAGSAGLVADGRPEATASRVEMVLDQIDQLPTLPAVATRLLSVTSRADTSAREVIELIESDQSLCAKILSLSQRADTGIAPDAARIDRAVVLMGLDAIRNIVLAIKVFETFGPETDVPDGVWSRTEFWKHSLAVACAAQLIAAERGDGVDPEESFVCGLLHDLGKVALDSCLPKSYERVARLCRANRACIADVERELLGVDHPTAGRRLAERWGLPEKVVNCIWLHHHPGELLPPSLAHREYVEVVHLADVIAREQRIGFSGNFACARRAADVAAAQGLDAGALRRVVGQLADRIAERAGIVGLDRLTSERLYLNALASANEELARLNASLAERNVTLRVRSRFFEALQQFGASLSATSRVRDICAAAAEAVAVATESEAVLVFFDARQESSRCTALKVDDGPPAVDVRSTEGGSASSAWEAAQMPLVPAEAFARDVLEPFGPRLGEPPYWMIPLTHGGRVLGGAVFAASQPRANRLAKASDELGALGTAVGVALGSAEARAAASRLNDELAAINRWMQNAEAEILRARSLSMLAEMASGAAHELNNPLAVISGRAQLLADEADDGPLRDALRLIQDHAKRCSHVVSELMEFAQPSSPAPADVDLGGLLEDIRASWLGTGEMTAERFRLTLEPDAGRVWADEDQLRTVIGELIRNGIEAADEGEARLVVNCRRDLTDETVVIEVQDHGRGMEPDVLARAFDPFFSHRPAGRGRGLGLSRAYRLAELARGTLWLESTPSQGTTARLKLPTRPSRTAGQTE